MSAEVLRRTFRRVAALNLDLTVERQVLSVVRAAAPGPGRALLAAGAEAGLHPETVLDRAAAAFCVFAAFNLSDDLSDGECDYLSDQAGPVVLLIVHGLALSAVADLGLAPEDEAEVLDRLLRAEQAQVHEVGTTEWTAEAAGAVTDGIAGDQWAAYLRMMWAGTSFAGRAASVGRAVGRVALLAGDIVDGDQRYVGLPPADRTALIAQALEYAATLRKDGPEFARILVEDCEPILRGAVAG